VGSIESPGEAPTEFEPHINPNSETIMKISIPHPVARGGIAASFLCALSLGAVTASPVATAAADEAFTPRVTVTFSDLNPSEPRDALALYRRIRSAATSVCWRLDDNDLSSRIHMQACVQKAIADAVRKVNRPALVAVYNAHYRPPLPTTAAVAPAHP
jgi:UrcA family protein